MKTEIYNHNKKGGSIVKITSDSGNAIIIDYGLNLDGTEPEIPDLSDVKGIFITHFHEDHMGLLRKNPGIPVYGNEKAFKSFLIYANHMHMEFDSQFHFIKPNEDFQFYDFKIRPIPCSHSAFHSVMYFITVDGKRILHTGDFRLHGLMKNSLSDFNEFENSLDLLITEGTNIQNDLEAMTEDDLKEKFQSLQKKYRYIYVLTSSTNAERIRCINDSVNAGRYFVTDSFQDSLMKSWGNFRNLTYGRNLDEKLLKFGFTFLLRPSDYFKDIMKRFPKEDSVLVYSMWRGYLDIHPYLKDFTTLLPNQFIHTSGHVSRVDLERLIAYLNPLDVILIHTEHEEMLEDLDFDPIGMKDALLYSDPKYNDKYNNIFLLECDDKDISISYLQKEYKISFLWASMLKKEIGRYQSEDMCSLYMEMIYSMDKEILTRENIAYELNICYSVADLLLDRYYDERDGIWYGSGISE